MQISINEQLSKYYSYSTLLFSSYVHILAHLIFQTALTVKHHQHRNEILRGKYVNLLPNALTFFPIVEI